MKSKATGFLITALVFEILYIVGYIVILALQKTLATVYMPSGSGRSQTLVFPVVASVLAMISLLVLIVLVLAMMIQLNNGSTSFFCEITALVFFIGLIPLVSIILTPIETMLSARLGGADQLATLSMVQNSLGYLSVLSILSRLALTIGCSFSLCSKYENRN